MVYWEAGGIDKVTKERVGLVCYSITRDEYLSNI